MNETLEYLKMFARFPFALRRFLQHTMTLDEARRIVRERMEQREENFLRVVERSVYGYPRSPYLPLLKLARCELGDLCALVKQKGLEGALRELREQGVYITFEEFKGRKPIVRHGKTFAVTAHDFDNPFERRLFNLTTGGSTGAALNVGVDLHQIAASAPHELLRFSAHGLLDMPSMRWNPILPSATLRTILRGIYIGDVLQRWFSPIGLRDSKYWIKYGLATYYVLAWMRLLGVPVPLPEYVKPDQAIVIARCVAEMIHTRGSCCLHTNVSRALRVVLAAQETSLDLHGAVFAGSAEPTSPAKVRQIERAGARYIPNYTTVETATVGVGCARPAEVGDVHILKDAFALFSFDYPIKDFRISVPAFNLTTLLPSAAKVMLNVQMDDCGIVEERHCGCELETYGFGTHLRQIRSYSKLTGEGVTLIGNEIVHILEEVLPARFGGSPLDYQLLEQEDEQGFTRLYLVISPRVNIADEQAVVALMLKALSESSSMADAARTVWQETHTLQVKRIEPLVTARGKFMPLYIARHIPGAPQENST